MTKDEALKMALEALELSAVTVDSFGVQRKTQKAITAIKEALAQPAQKPVAWMDEYGDVLSASTVDGTGLRNIPLYTAPPQRTWVGLTDEELLHIGVATGLERAAAHMIEQALKEKNET